MTNLRVPTTLITAVNPEKRCGHFPSEGIRKSNLFEFLYRPFGRPLSPETAMDYLKLQSRIIDRSGAAWPLAAPSVWRRYGVEADDDAVLSEAAQCVRHVVPALPRSAQEGLTWNHLFDLRLTCPQVRVKQLPQSVSFRKIVDASQYGRWTALLADQRLNIGRFNTHLEAADLRGQFMDSPHLAHTVVAFAGNQVTYFYDALGSLIFQFAYLNLESDSRDTPLDLNDDQIQRSAVCFSGFDAGDSASALIYPANFCSKYRGINTFC